MDNKTKHEAAALEEGCAAAGEIIEGMIAGGYGSDFSQWPAEAFEAMVEAAIDGFRTKLTQLTASSEPPF